MQIKVIYNFIIRCKFFFLFIGQKPTKWPANNCLQIVFCSCARNVVQQCLAANNILLMRKWNHAFLFLVIALVIKMAGRFASRRHSLKNKHGDRMIKQYLLLNSVIAIYCVSSVSRNWQITILCSTLSNNCLLFSVFDYGLPVLLNLSQPWCLEITSLNLKTEQKAYKMNQ